MSFLPKLGAIAAVGAAAAVAVAAAAQFYRKKKELDDVVYTVEAGDFPQDEEFYSEEEAEEASYRPFSPDASLPSAPNRNPVDAPPVVRETDPSKIADPADFQDWE